MATDDIERLLAANERYVAAGHDRPAGSLPSRELAVLTCMDTRIDPLAVLGLELGEAHVLRNAGGRVTDDVLRSLVLSVHLLGVRTLVVMHHTRCGLADTTDDDLRARTRTPFTFLSIGDHESALRSDVQQLTETPHLAPVADIAAFLYDVDSGGLQRTITWHRNAE
jgi:carbonic anhydrase